MIYRKGTVLPETKVAFMFNCGGIGDFIHYTPAIQYAIEHNPQLYGFIVAPRFFIDLARIWFAKYDRFKVVPGIPETHVHVIPIGPNKYQIVSSASTHLVQLGFIFYNQLTEVPEGWHTPQLTGDEVSLKWKLPEKFAVLPFMSTAWNRSMSPELAQAIIDRLIYHGITPVILGKRALAKDYEARPVDGADTSQCLDLREQTTLLEAAAIIKRARFIVGMDSGLMHLARTVDAPALWIFTSVNPKYRLIAGGSKQIVYIPPESLECRFCESNMRFLPPGSDTRRCLYRDYKCLDIDPNEIVEMLEEMIAYGEQRIRDSATGADRSGEARMHSTSKQLGSTEG